MSSGCDDASSLEAVQGRQRGTLQLVLGINVVMFVVIVVAALRASSTALLADSLDDLGDALTYGLSLYVVSRDVASKARVALLKGGLILLGAAAVSAQIVYRAFMPATPIFEIMGGFSLLGLAANSTCVVLLWRHRSEDVNMSSVWECSRNDIVGNVSVFLASGAVWLTHARWPDLLVAFGLVVFLARSAVRVVSAAVAELRAASGGAVPGRGQAGLPRARS